MINDYSFLEGWKGKIVVCNMYDKWQEQKEKYLFNGEITKQNLREILPNEIIIEFDHKQEWTINSEEFNQARNEAEKWINKIKDILVNQKINFYITDHKGKSSHLRFTIKGLEEYDFEYRKEYKIKLVEDILKEINFKSDIVQLDRSLIVSKNKLVSLEHKPHFKEKWKGEIEKIIFENTDKKAEVKKQIMNNLIKDLKNSYTTDNKEISSECINIQDVDIGKLKDFWKIYYKEGCRNNIVLAFGGLCRRKGLSIENSKILLKELIGNISELQSRYKELSYSFESDRKDIAVLFHLKKIFNSEEANKVYSELKRCFLKTNSIERIIEEINEENKFEKIREILNLLTFIKDDLRVQDYLKKVGNKTNTSLKNLEKEFNKIKKNNENRNQTKQELNVDSTSLRILKDKEIFDNITIKEFDKKIVGEIKSRQTIFLSCCGSWVENHNIASYNQMVNSESGVGKDWVTSKVLDILPKDMVIKRTRISEKVLNYWHNSKFEPNWTWNGKIFYNEDISNSVLNADVFKVMCSSESSVTILINQQPIDIEIKGKPVMLITTATANPKKEMLRRFTIVNLDESIDQTKAILQRQAEYEQKGLNVEYDKNITKALSHLRRIKVRIPYAENLVCIFPTQNIVIRTHFQRFLDYIKASCSLHQFQREIDVDGYYLATLQDYDIARIGLIHTTSNKFMIPLTKDEQKILKIFEDLPEYKTNKGEQTKVENFEDTQKEYLAWYSVSDLEPKVTFVSDKWFREILDKLTNLGFLYKDKEKRDKSDRPVMVWRYLKHTKINIPESKDIPSLNIQNTTNSKTPSNATITSNASNPINQPIEIEKGIEGIEAILPKIQGTKTFQGNKNPHILDLIKDNDKGEGVNFEVLLPLSNLKENELQAELKSLSTKGDIFEHKQDRWKVL